MRLFAALFPPARVLDGPGQLAEAVAALRSADGAGELRWTDRAGWHITLAFYGEVPEERLPELTVRLARAARRGRPLRLRIAGSGRFGDRTLWAGIAPVPGEPDEGGAAEALRRLAATTSAAGRRMGLGAQEPGRFHAHLTVARVRPSAPPAAGLRPCAEALEPFRGEPWTADEIALVRSEPPRSGRPGEQPRYEQVAAWPLGRSDVRLRWMA